MTAMLKVTELFSKAILLSMFVYGDCMAVCSILYTSATDVAEMDESTNLKWCPHTFVNIVYRHCSVLYAFTYLKTFWMKRQHPR